MRSFCLVVLALAAAACSKGPLAPSESADLGSETATVTEIYTSVLPVGGSKFYSWSAARTGSVTATLLDIGGPGVPSSVVVALGIGSPSGTTCLAAPSSVQTSGDAGATTSVTATQGAGVSCVVISDIGNLFAPASFTVTIEHP